MYLYFFISVLSSFLLALVIRKIALHYQVVDVPDGQRKLHARAVSLWGGVAIFSSFWLVITLVAWNNPGFLFRHLTSGQLWAIFLASLLIIVVGMVDDVRSLSPWVRFLVSILAVLLVVFWGVDFKEITNPLGGVLHLGIIVFSIPFLSVVLTIGGIVVFGWLMGMMYTTKILDGLDGLATGVVAIGALVIFFLTQTKKFYQPDVGLLALVFAGVCIGFLFLNFHPARIFLGESGSLFIGFMLGILAVISGGKIATALLVMAVPILDLGRVIYLRIRGNHKVYEGDREHLHFRLLDAGFSERSTVLFLYTISLLFGLTTLFLESFAKVITLLILSGAMVLVGIWLGYKKTTIKK
jgi:UDP-GlcNAc:undecaprenyl-phosphate GlcNAc-1-phosphate transferase